MKRAIDNIVLVKEKFQISVTQAVFLLAMNEGIDGIDIDPNDLIFLINEGHVNGNKLSVETRDDIEKLIEVQTVGKVRKNIGVTYPVLTKETGEIVKKLAVTFLGDRLDGKEFDRVEAYFPNNVLMVPFFFMFLQMFPSSLEAKNKHWEKKFGAKWTQATLRRMSTGTANKFKQIWKTKDMGLFLLGTFLFIQHSYSQESDKFFIKKIENYLKEYQMWYEMAEDALETGKLDHLTKKVHQKSNTYVPE
jgi:hypothetical protein